MHVILLEMRAPNVGRGNWTQIHRQNSLKELYRQNSFKELYRKHIGNISETYRVVWGSNLEQTTCMITPTHFLGMASLLKSNFT